eukprot:TRINITY_DN3607_c0_g1_i1.p1 TRINITY_DN3607_c0_g1~~TRINITY_DN3607_c0_g1_i1.p1  ORF type:complete len:429 (+),score=66.03 TRINITY_DN3607_c0_g1_i1:119-1405(+)
MNPIDEPASIGKQIVKIQSCEGAHFEISEEIVNMCTTVKNLLRGSGKRAFKNALGGQFSIEEDHVILKKEGRVLATLLKKTDDEAIILLHDVKSATLGRVFDYCKYHADSSINEKDRKTWDAKFVQVDQTLLCELASASYYLDIKSLVNLTSKAIATHVSGKSREEIRESIINNSDWFSGVLGVRYRLHRKIVKKKEELPQLEGGKEVAPQQPAEDNRSLDELLEFIGESPAGNKSAPSKKSSKKKKNKNKKDKTKSDDQLRGSTDSQSASESSPPSSIKLNNSGSISPTQKALAKEATEQAKDRSKTKFKRLELLQRSGGSDLSMSRDSALDSAHSIDSANSARSSHLKESRSAMSAGDSDDSKMAEASDLELEDDEELDPEQLAALDKEVEEFRQRLEAMNREVRGPKLRVPIKGSAFSTSVVDVC